MTKVKKVPTGTWMRPELVHQLKLVQATATLVNEGRSVRLHEVLDVLLSDALERHGEEVGRFVAARISESSANATGETEVAA